MKVRAKLGLGFLVVVLLIWVTVFFAGNTYSNIDEEFQLLRDVESFIKEKSLNKPTFPRVFPKLVSKQPIFSRLV